MDQRKKAAIAKLRDLQGPPLVVLFTMLIVRKPVTKSFLAMALRLDEKTISNAVDFLEFEGHIQRIHYRAWMLNNGQLTLPGFEIGLLNADVPVLQAETGNSPVSGSETPSETGNSPVSAHVHVHTTTTCISKVGSSSTVPSETGNSPVSDELEATLRELRIGGEAILAEYWPRIAACEWVTPHYLRAMATRINERADTYRNPGFFVHCVLAHDPEPEWYECCNGLGGHRENCRQRYLQGPYADLVEH